MTDAKGPNRGGPDREKLARIVMTWTGCLLAVVIVGLFSLWFFINQNAMKIDTANLFANGNVDQKLQATNSLLETQARLSAQSAKDMAQLLLTALLPLFGTWVGTVLAYFFSREGFESASQAQLQLIKQLPLMDRLRQFKVSDRMVPRARMEVLALNDAQVKNAASVDLPNLLDVLKKPTVTRLPILGPQDHFVCLVHKSLKDRFIAAKAIELATEGKAVDVSALTLQDLLAMPNDGGDVKVYRTFGDLAEKAVVFVCEEKTLADAKEKMDRVPGCQDVFVTHTGADNEPVLGWLTNVEFAKAAETFA